MVSPVDDVVGRDNERLFHREAGVFCCVQETVLKTAGYLGLSNASGHPVLKLFCRPQLCTLLRVVFVVPLSVVSSGVYGSGAVRRSRTVLF